MSGATADEATPLTIPEEAPILVVLPGLGFDLEGVRLGRGGGFYDRALASLRRARPVFAVGVGFEAQVVGRLPCEAWDQRVDLIVTEQRCIVPQASLVLPQARHRAQEVREP